MSFKQEAAPLGRLPKIGLALAVASLVVFIFFRQQFFNHFTFLSGDRFDAVIEAALLEHWFNVFKGIAHWNSPNYFFPYDKTLSHNEGLFIYGIIYSFFRTLSFDALLSSELLNMTIKAIGFAGFFAAARRLLQLPYSWSLLGAAIFTLSNNSFLQAAHAQLLSVSLAPVEAMLIYAAYSAFISGNSSRFFAIGSAAALFFSAWMLTCLYTAWFFVTFVLITAGLQLLMIGRKGWASLGNALLVNKAAIIGVALVAAVSLLPFYSVYLAGHDVSRQRPWSEILYYSPTLIDSINVGGNNLLFGRAIIWLRNHYPDLNIGGGEMEAGISPLLFLIALVASVGLLIRKVLPSPSVKILIWGTALATIVFWLLSLHYEYMSGWYIMYKYWPGGSGLRVVARVFLFLMLPITALAMWYLSQMRRWPRLIMGAVCVLLLLEQINTAPTTTLNRLHENALTLGVAPPPAGCNAFYTTASPDTVDHDPGFAVGALYPHNVDAMLIAEYVNLPTINGFASFNPADWNFGHPTDEDYLLRVGEYAKKHGLSGLCQLDLASKQWTTHPEFIKKKSMAAFWDFAHDKDLSELLKGFDSAEPFGRWSSGHNASLSYTLPDDRQNRLLKIRITAINALASAEHVQRVRISVDHGPEQEFSFNTSGRQNLELTAPAPPGNTGVISFAFPDAVSPRTLGMNEDDRLLAIAVQSIEIR